MGKVLVIGGSNEYSGAPILTALLCTKWQFHVDVITINDAVSSLQASANSYDNITVLNGVDPFVEDDSEIIKTVEIIKTNKYITLIMGPGLGPCKDMGAFVVKLMLRVRSEIDIPIVMDADATRALVYNKNFIKQLNEIIEMTCPLILTPNHMEWMFMTVKIKEWFLENEDQNTLTPLLVNSWLTPLTSKDSHPIYLNKTPATVFVLLKNVDDYIIMSHKEPGTNDDKWSSILYSVDSPEHNSPIRTCGQGDILAGIIGIYAGTHWGCGPEDVLQYIKKASYDLRVAAYSAYNKPIDISLLKNDETKEMKYIIQKNKLIKGRSITVMDILDEFTTPIGEALERCGSF